MTANVVGIEYWVLAIEKKNVWMSAKSVHFKFSEETKLIYPIPNTQYPIPFTFVQ